jgi:OPA family glycerol-3-phosphate transporter-like MFS transporter
MEAAAPFAAAAPIHSPAFRVRRFWNWFPLGLAYAFLYMGRYNLTVAKNALGSLMTNEDFGLIFAAGTVVYGFAFLVNGPLTDRIGGKRAMLIAAFGAGAANLAMGIYLQSVVGAGTVNGASLRRWFSLLYAMNMYFQSFGAVSIVKVNAQWFHVRERGGFGGIFGTMIASGIFMAFTVNGWILDFAKGRAGGASDVLYAQWVFFVPAVLLGLIALIEVWLLKDRPGLAGHSDFDAGDASTAERVPSQSDLRTRARDWPGALRLPWLGLIELIGWFEAGRLMLVMLSHPIVLTVALIELCTGVIRQGVMQWYPIYAKSVLALPHDHLMRDGSWGSLWSVLPFFGTAAVLFFLATRRRGARRGWAAASGAVAFLAPFLHAGWGGLLFVAGVIGGNVAGYVSDLIFQSRRPPVGGLLYGLLVLCSVAMIFTMGRALPIVASSADPALQRGDRIVSVAGQTGLEDWPAVSEAFASVPARCVGGATWDSARHLCSTEPTATDPSLSPSAGQIPVEVERGGTRVIVPLKDPSPQLRAGDRRVLKAAPLTTITPFALGAVVFLMSLCVIGTHGVLSGTASADFGGKKGAATATGMIDGFVYLGTAIQSVSLGYLTTRSWDYWPYFLLPFGIVGLLLCRRVWNATPRPTGAPATAPAPVVTPEQRTPAEAR